MTQWKKCIARHRPDVALALTLTFLRSIVGSGNTEGQNFEDHLETFIEAASQITDFIDLDTFIDPVRVPDTLKAEAEKEKATSEKLKC